MLIADRNKKKKEKEIYTKFMNIDLFWIIKTFVKLTLVKFRMSYRYYTSINTTQTLFSIIIQIFAVCLNLCKKLKRKIILCKTFFYKKIIFWVAQLIL